MYYYFLCTIFVVLLTAPSALCQSSSNSGDSSEGLSCGSNATISGSQCLCYSGFAPSTAAAVDCNVEALASCPWETVDTNTTGATPALNSTGTYFLFNNLTLTVQSPIVSGRTLTQIQVGGSSDAACTYPGANFVKTIEDCDDTFIGSIPWSAHTLCNFVEDDSDSEYTVYSAPIYVTNTEVVGEFRGTAITRTVTEVLNIAVKFPKEISISTSTAVVAPVNMFSAVTQQAYSSSSAQGTISFATSLEWPFSLETGSVDSLPAGLTVSNGLIDATPAGDCGSTNGSSCYQVFTFDVLPSSACQLTGDYVIDFVIVCRGSDACPLDSTDNSAQVTLSLESADFCATLSTGITVTSKLASYEDAAHTTAKTAFIIDQTGYFSLSASSAQANISATEIVSISITEGTTTTTIYTSTGTSDAAILLVTNGAGTSSFEIDFTESLFPVPTDASQTYSFTVTIALTFLDNNGSKKRSVYALSSTSSSATANVAIQKSTVTIPSTSGAMPLGAQFALAGCLLLVSMM